METASAADASRWPAYRSTIVFPGRDVRFAEGLRATNDQVCPVFRGESSWSKAMQVLARGNRVTRTGHVFSVILFAAICLMPFLHTSPAVAASANGQLHGILGDYDAILREPKAREDGQVHVDTPRTIAELKRLHVNTYAYLVSKPTDWGDFRSEFLPAAQAAGINTWVFLVPPSECHPQLNQCSFPHNVDYVGWGTEIAQLSLQYPTLSAWAIDDFDFNLRKFTPRYVAQMRQATGAINPALKFLPIVYHRSYNAQFAGNYAHYFDGVIFPFKDDPEGDNDKVGTLKPQLDAISALLAPYNVPVVLMVYATPFNTAPIVPNASYVRQALDTGISMTRQGTIAGVLVYGLPIDGNPRRCIAREGTGALEFYLRGAHPTTAGQYVEASQRVTVNSAASSYSVSFWTRHSIGPSGPAGFPALQLLVDGQVAWQSDLTSDAANAWHQSQVDLSQYLRGKEHATIAFRMAETKRVFSYGAMVWVDQVKAQGFTLADGGFENSSSWNLNSPFAQFGVYYDICTTDRSTKINQAAGELFGAGI